MIEVKPPYHSISYGKEIFLAGSIEMGKAEDWQTKIVSALSDIDGTIYNPRRDNWDPSWEQDPTPGTPFHEQVTWELDKIMGSDLVVFYFDPNTISPITLAELGLVIGLGKNTLVCCPDGYFRKGNVVIMCGLRLITVLDTLDDLITATQLVLGVDKET